MWAASTTAVDCRRARRASRADKLVEDDAPPKGSRCRRTAGATNSCEAYIRDHDIPCPECGKRDYCVIRKFNIMFRTHQGVTEDSAAEITCGRKPHRAIFVNF